MKRLIILLFCLLFLLSGCYSYSEVQKKLDEQQEASDKEYSELEEQYLKALSRIEDLETSIGKLYEMSLDLNDYFEDESISFEEAQEKYDDLYSFIYALSEGE